jgi:antitoxin component of RelBE/YafQ-DinJ toxin-antitoxin module
MELKTARLTILIDPAKKIAFEELCRTQDMTPSQVVRRLIREFMEHEQPPLPVRKAAPAKRAASAKGRAPVKASAPRKALSPARRAR